MLRAHHREHIQGLLARMLKARIVSRFNLVAPTASRRQAAVFGLLSPSGVPDLRRSKWASALSKEAGVLTGTKRIVGRVTASQIASASAASFLPRST
jgi:hypothetical protein